MLRIFYMEDRLDPVPLKYFSRTCKCSYVYSKRPPRIVHQPYTLFIRKNNPDRIRSDQISTRFVYLTNNPLCKIIIPFHNMLIEFPRFFLIIGHKIILTYSIPLHILLKK